MKYIKIFICYIILRHRFRSFQSRQNNINKLKDKQHGNHNNKKLPS